MLYPKSNIFGVQPVNIKRFWCADRQYQSILRCSLSISSDFAEMSQNHVKKLDLAERIRMHRSRASGASNLSRYDLFCMALCCTLQSLVNALDRSKVAHGHVFKSLVFFIFTKMAEYRHHGHARSSPSGRTKIQVVSIVF